MAEAEPFFELRDIRKDYLLRRGLLQRFTDSARRVSAVDGVTLAIERGAIFGLVGESGCGKSTLAQVIVRLIEPTSGSIVYQGRDVASFDAAERRAFRHAVQMVFQDTGTSLNPRKRIRVALGEALKARGVAGAEADLEIAALMDQVGLDAVMLGRYPHELSGGQRQRVGIARALAMRPEILVADEPVSALDVSLQGQIVNLLRDLNERLGVTIVLISHDLAVVARICTEIGVMNAGRIVERGAPSEVLSRPKDPYTQTLLDSVPRGLAGRKRGSGAAAAGWEPQAAEPDAERRRSASIAQEF